LLAIARQRDGLLILVTNEVGASVVPPTILGRVYRDLLGRVNRRAAGAASRAWLLVAGRALELPG
jgi:adenosylcobinamide kinase/adenosylcobinamide-phosphate guanylyltransferase